MFVKCANGAEYVQCGVRGDRGCATFSEGLVGRRVGKGITFCTGLRRGLGACVGSPWWLLVAGGLGELTKCQALVVDK